MRTIAEVADAADAVFVCVFSDQHVRTVCADNGLLAMTAPGSAQVLHTTGSRRRPTLAACCTDIAVIDAPVSGGPAKVEEGTRFVGGSGAPVERVRPLLAAYGDAVLHVGDTDAGQRIKLVNNELFAPTTSLVAEMITFGEWLGLAEAATLTTLPHGSSSSRALSMADSAGSISTLLVAEGEILAKDARVVFDLADELDVDPAGLGAPLETVRLQEALR